MISPLIPVKVGQKGPPYISDWQKATPSALVLECRAWPGSNIGLRLDKYLALDPDDTPAAEILDGLEKEGKLPPTVAWRTWRGMIVRLYQRREGLEPVKPRQSPKLEFRTGPGQYVLVPPSQINMKNYHWLDGQDPDSIEVSILPEESFNYLFNLLKDTSVYSICKTHAKKLSFSQGSRDDDLFYAAISLLQGHVKEPDVRDIIDRLAKSCDPPFPENEAQIKVDSALKKYLGKERSITDEVREWVLTSSGLFLTSDVHKELDLTSRDLKKQANEAIRRLANDGILAPCGVKRGCYRLIEADSPMIDFINADISEVYDIYWPFELEKLVNIYPKNIIILAGAPNAGKTAFLLNTIKKNMDRHRIEYFSSEMGPEELKLRLSKFDDLELKDWKFYPRERAFNFADAIVPDALNIVDYLEITEDFSKIAGEIKMIFDRLNKGIAIIAIQKKIGADLGRGAEFSLEKARLYLSMDGGKLKIIKAKNWVSSLINPNNMELKFKLVGGAMFIEYE